MCEHCEDLPEEVKKLREPYEGIKGCQNIWKDLKGKKYEDLTGFISGKLTAIKPVGRTSIGEVLWLCKCKCSNKIILRGHIIKKKKQISCGCMVGQFEHHKSSIDKYTGKTFNELTILEEVESKGHHRYVKCLCSCGKIFNIRLDSVLSGHTKSCGHIGTEERKARHKSLVGKTFGELYVKERIENRGESVMYRCVCSCGGILDVDGMSLRSHRVSSCGCLISKGEYIIGNLLKAKKITFIKQKTFKDLVTDKNGRLRFDFYIPKKKYFIEYDGEHHFNRRAKGYMNDEHLKEVQYRDSIKNEYCKKKGYTLIRIPYMHFDEICIKDLLPETSKFIIN